MCINSQPNQISSPGGNQIWFIYAVKEVRKGVTLINQVTVTTSSDIPLKGGLMELIGVKISQHILKSICFFYSAKLTKYWWSTCVSVAESYLIFEVASEGTVRWIRWKLIDRSGGFFAVIFIRYTWFEEEGGGGFWISMGSNPFLNKTHRLALDGWKSIIEQLREMLPKWIRWGK